MAPEEENAKSLEGYFLAGRNIPWWATYLSIMATQASAITFIGTTGIAYTEDMRFVQVYLAILRYDSNFHFFSSIF